MARHRIIFLVSALALGSTAAQAHPRLVSSTPAGGATVAGPTAIRLTFSERLVGPMTGANVVMTGMANAGHHPPVKINGFVATLARDGKSFQMVRPKPLAPGNYVVAWHAVSVDTHRVQGTLRFRVR